MRGIGEEGLQVETIDPSKWEGQNVLGGVLMQLRKDLWREGGYRIW